MNKIVTIDKNDLQRFILFVTSGTPKKEYEVNAHFLVNDFDFDEQDETEELCSILNEIQIVFEYSIIDGITTVLIYLTRDYYSFSECTLTLDKPLDVYIDEVKEWMEDDIIDYLINY